MKRLIKKCVVAFGAAAVLCTCAYAAEPMVTYDYSNNKVSVSGEADGESVVIHVLKKDKTAADLKNTAEDAEILLYSKQLDCGSFENGKYVFNIRYAKSDDKSFESGVYNAYLADGSGEVTEIKLDLFARSSYVTAAERLNEYAKAGAVTEFKETLEENYLMLGYNKELYDKVDNTDVISACMDYVAENNFDAEKSNENKQVINRFLIMEALNGNKIDNADEYIVQSIDAGSDIYKDYVEYTADASGKASSARQKFLTGKMADAIDGDYEFGDYMTALEQGLLLTAVRYAGGSDDVKNAIDSYGESVGITQTASDSVCRALSGKDYSASELKKAYDSARSNGGNQTGNRPSGGSGSGGTGGTGGTGGGFGGGSNTQYKIDDASAEAPDAIKIYFNDIDGVDWAAEAIIALADKGIINGKSEGAFKPDDFVTREEFAKILVGAMGYANEEYSGNAFSDVYDRDWFCSYVNIAYEKNILKGTGDGKFGTGEQISRQDMVVMIYNALVMRGKATVGGELIFEDKELIADYACPAVAALYEIGAVNGVSETVFDPLGSATRAQAAKIIYGVLEMLQ